MLIVQIRTYEGHISFDSTVEALGGLDKALDVMRNVAKQWREEDCNLDTCVLMDLSTPEDDEDPDNVVAYVDEERRDPIVVVGNRLEMARQALQPN